MTGTTPPVAGRISVFVRGLEIQAGIGVHDHEQGRLQRLVIDVTLDLAPRPIARLSDTVDYGAVADMARAIAAQGHVGLVETFAERLALECLADPRVAAVEVRVEKPGALDGAAAPGCVVRFAR